MRDGISGFNEELLQQSAKCADERQIYLHGGNHLFVEYEAIL